MSYYCYYVPNKRKMRVGFLPSYCINLLEYLEILASVDNMVSSYPYGNPITAAILLLKPGGSALLGE